MSLQLFDDMEFCPLLRLKCVEIDFGIHVGNRKLAVYRCMRFELDLVIRMPSAVGI